MAMLPNYYYLVPKVKWTDGAAVVELEDHSHADVVEVVRCRDCIYYKESELLGPTKFCYRLKDRDEKPIGYNFTGSDFCSRGQRRAEAVSDV